MKDRNISSVQRGTLTVLVMTALLAASAPIGPMIAGPSDPYGVLASPRASGPVRASNVSSITGTHEISDIAYMRFLGDGTPTSNGGLGSFVGPLDLDGDGGMELALSAPGITSKGGDVDAGIVYVLNGTPELGSSVVDLQESLLDLTIRSTSPYSALLGSISSGDLNDDGHEDLVIGAPSWPDTGKVCVLWGSSEGFPPEIDLVRIVGATPNGNPVGFLRTESYAVIAGYVTTSVLGTMLGKSVMVGDLDLDGIDDLVFTFHGWNSIFIVWGDPDKMQFGTDYTYLRDSQQTSQFAYGCVMGDMDGDGTLDLAISAPTADDEVRGLAQVGSVSVIFNVGRVKGNSSLQIQEVARPNIYGRDPYDLFGLGLALRDVNLDGRADLFVGAPGDDGPNNDRYEAGHVMVFYGADVLNFPTYMVGIDRCDKVIYGSQGGIGGAEPDGFGGTFSVGDLDGDGKCELIAGFPGKDGDGKENAGNCVVYSHADTLGISGITGDLAKVVPRAVIMGDDPYDGLGYMVRAMDINDDSIDDLVISSPGADGPDNDRPGAGEAYLLLGSSLMIDSITLSGEAVSEGTIYTGAGAATIRVGFRQYPQALGTISAVLVLDPDGLDITLSYSSGEFHEKGDTFDLVEVLEDRSSIASNGESGSLSLTVELDWAYYVTEDFELHVSLRTESGPWVERTFTSPFEVLRDVRIGSGPSVLKNGAELPTGHEWFSSGDLLSMTGLALVYSDDSGRAFNGSRAKATFFRDGTSIGSAKADVSWTVQDVVPPVEGSVRYSILISHGEDEVPEGFPPGLLPRTGPQFAIDIKVDDSGPAAPEGVVAMPDPDRRSLFDDDEDWELSWEASIDDTSGPVAGKDLRELDDNGSGTRGFLIQVNDGEPFEAMTYGGLHATYFRDGNFSEHGMMRLDSTLHFTEEDWGMWGPDPLRVPPYGYSARWDGGVIFPRDRYYTFELSGMGMAKMVMDDVTVMDWSDLVGTPSTAARFRSAGEMSDVQIYFRQSGPSSSISFLVDDDRGDFVPVPAGELYHLSTRAAVRLPGPGAHRVSLTAFDWAGRSGQVKEMELVVERDPPGFNLSEYLAWYAEPDPTVDLVVYDPSSFGGHGSGVNSSSIEYRLRQGSDTAFGAWTSEGRKVSAMTAGPELPSSVRTSFKLQLTNDWSGQVQFKARDGAGNEVQSSSLFLGVDMVPPVLGLLSPDLGSPQKSSGFDLIIRSFDGKGSGVDGGTIGYRLRPRSSADWGDWTLLGQTDMGPEVLSTLNLRLSRGDYVLQFQAQDTVGNLGLSPLYNLTVQDPVADMPPVPRISAPLEGAIYRIGYPVPLDATGTTDDGLGRYPSLVLTWFSNISGYLGSGAVLTTYKMTPGNHRIALYADDGSPGHNMTAVVNITIRDMDDGGPPPNGSDDDDDDDLLLLLVVFAIITVLIAVLVIFLMVRYRARKEEEIRLEYAARTEDDEYYDERVMEEERSLGIHVEDQSLSGEELEKKRRELYGDDEA